MDYPKDYRKFLKADWYEYQKPENKSDQAKGLPRPPVEKPFPDGAKLIDLVAPADITIGDAPLLSIINKRRSRRQYTEAPLSLEELSFLLWSTQGVVKLIARPGRPAITLRTVPSGGSMHSFETYLVINRVTGIEPGLYRYIALEHKLLFIRSEPDMHRKVAAACLDQEFIGDGAVIFIWTTIPYRAEWRYSVVAHKSIAMDAGHMCQNLYLAAEAIGAGTCAIGAYFQDQIDDFVGVDGEDEFVIYVAPVGKIERK